MKNPTTQSVLNMLYDIAKLVNARPISGRMAAMQAIINVAEGMAKTGEISPELGSVLIDEARVLMLK